MESLEPVTCASAGIPIKTYRQASKPTANRHSASTVIQPFVCLRAALLAGSLSILPPELVRPRNRCSRWTTTAARQRRLPHDQSPDYALKYLQLRAISQSHFRNSSFPSNQAGGTEGPWTVSPYCRVTVTGAARSKVTTLSAGTETFL